MTTNEIIKEIAVYDGYTHKETVTGDGVFTRDEDQEFYTYIDLEDYLTDLNMLHRVVVKVFCDVLSCKHGTISEVNAICENIKHEFINLPNEQGEHIELATATVEAIIYLKKHKA